MRSTRGGGGGGGGLESRALEFKDKRLIIDVINAVCKYVYVYVGLLVYVTRMRFCVVFCITFIMLFRDCRCKH